MKPNKFVAFLVRVPKDLHCKTLQRRPVVLYLKRIRVCKVISNVLFAQLHLVYNHLSYTNLLFVDEFGSGQWSMATNR